MIKKETVIHGTTTVGERGQIVIPQSIRTALDIKAGDEMVVIARGKKIIIVPAEEIEEFYQSILDRMDTIRDGLKKK